MINDVRHVGIVVSNLQNALTFWCDVLGFKKICQMDESGPHIDSMMGLSDVCVTTVKLAAEGGSMVELLKFNSHKDKDKWVGTPFMVLPISL